MLPVRDRLQLFLLPASLKFFKPLTTQKTRFIFSSLDAGVSIENTGCLQWIHKSHESTKSSVGWLPYRKSLISVKMPLSIMDDQVGVIKRDSESPL